MRFSTYKKYIHNLSQNNFDSFANYIYAKIVILFTIDLTFFGIIINIIYLYS